MQDRTRLPVEQLHDGIHVVEEAIRQAGATPFERRRCVDMFQHAKGRLAALDAIEKELKASGASTPTVAPARKAVEPRAGQSKS